MALCTVGTGGSWWATEGLSNLSHGSNVEELESHPSWPSPAHEATLPF